MTNKTIQNLFRHAGSLRGVARPDPFFAKNWSCLKRQLKLDIFQNSFSVEYGQKKIPFLFRHAG